MTSELLWGGPWCAAEALLGFFPSRDFDSMAAARPGGPARTWRSAPRLIQIGVDHEKYAALGILACHADIPVGVASAGGPDFHPHGWSECRPRRFERPKPASNSARLALAELVRP